MYHLRAVSYTILTIYITSGCSTGTGNQSDGDDGVDSGGATQDAGSSDSDADADADYEIDYSCGDDCPPDMVEVPGMCACIDAFEYSIGRFVSFLNKKGSNDCQGYDCRMMGIEESYVLNMYEVINDDESPEFITDEPIKATDGGLFQTEEGFENFPVGLVTWYGADTACRWEGKRLCPQEIWYAACSHNGEWHFPYGGTTGGVDSYDGYMSDYIRDNCNTGGYGYTSQVGTFPECEGGYLGIFDMAGNVEEWVEVDGDGSYMLLGGTHYTNDAEDGEEDNGAGCKFNGINIVAENGDKPLSGANSYWGFRCCVMGNP